MQKITFSQLYAKIAALQEKPPIDAPTIYPLSNRTSDWHIQRAGASSSTSKFCVAMHHEYFHPTTVNVVAIRGLLRRKARNHSRSRHHQVGTLTPILRSNLKHNFGVRLKQWQGLTDAVVDGELSLCNPPSTSLRLIRRLCAMSEFDHSLPRDRPHRKSR